MRIVQAIFHQSKMLLTLMVILLCASVYAVYEIPKERDPDIQIPYLFVSVSMPGISPQDAVNALYKPLDNAVRNIKGVKSTSGATRTGGVAINVQLETTANQKDVMDAVTKAVGQVVLPEDAKSPKVSEISIGDSPIIRINLESTGDKGVLRQLANTIKKDLKNTKGVLKLKTLGTKEQYLEIIVDPHLMNGYGIAPNTIKRLFANMNTILSPGTQLDRKHGDFSLKISAQVRDIKKIMELPLRQNGSETLRLKDIATYQLVWNTSNIINRLNQNDAIRLEVIKRPDANLKKTTERVKAYLETIKKNIPNTIKITTLGDQSKDVDSMLSYMQNSILTSVLCIMVVIIALLGLRDGVMVGITIPMSFLFGIASLYLMGLTLNSVVLFGLTLSLGILIDNAIVIVEYADLKIRQGYTVAKSYKKAVQAMGTPLILSTLTTLAVFLPLIFWPGIMGQFMRYIPLSMILVLTSSLFVALVFTPLLAKNFNGLARLFIAGAIAILIHTWTQALLVSIASPIVGLIVPKILAGIVFVFIWIRLKKVTFSKDTHIGEKSLDIEKCTIPEFITQASSGAKMYYRALCRLLQRPRMSILIVVTSIGCIYGLMSVAGLKTSFFPNDEPDYLSITVESPGNFSLKEKDTYMREVEKAIFAYTQNNTNIEFINTEVGGADIGEILIFFVDWKDRTQSPNDIRKELKSKLSKIVGLKINIDEPARGPSSPNDLVIRIVGTDFIAVQKSINNIYEFIKNHPKYEKVNSTSRTEGLEYRYVPNAKNAKKYNVSLSSIANTIQMVTNGMKLATFTPLGTDTDMGIYLRYPPQYRTLTDLDNLWVQSPSGPIPLSYVVDKKLHYPIPQVRLNDGETGGRITANLRNKGNNRIAEQDKILASLKNRPDLLLGDTKIKKSSAKQDEDETKTFLMVAFGLAIGLMFILLLYQFNSFYLIFVILCAIVFSTAGVMLGIIIMGQSFSIVMTGLAIITLSGVVVNDNIVLIDTFKNICRTESDMKIAVIKTSLLRLGPVILTSITTALGMLPAAFMVSVDILNRDITIGSPNAMFWQQISQNIVVGILFALVLTLIFTPCALYAKYRKTPYIPK